MTNDIEELTKNLKKENRERAISFGPREGKNILCFNVDGLKLEDIGNILKDIRKNVPKEYNKKQVYIHFDGVFNNFG